MKPLLFGIAALVVTATVAGAADGCGRGMFYDGRRCVPQDGPGYGPPPYQRGYDRYGSFATSIARPKIVRKSRATPPLARINLSLAPSAITTARLTWQCFANWPRIFIRNARV